MEKIAVLFGENDEVFVDTAFINNCKGKIEGSELKHMGFGEFFLQTPEGNIQFARRDSQKWDGMSGRGHKIYDNNSGELVVELLHKMSNLITKV